MQMADIDKKVGLKREDNFDADPNLNAIKGEIYKMQLMLNEIKADINHAVASHSGALQSAIATADIDI
jgi:hypothetical protein